MEYSHAFVRSTGEVIEIADFAKLGVCDSLAVRERGFVLFESVSEIVLDKFGQPSRRDRRRWSYGHLRRGWVCAGAGALNSLPLIKIA